MCLALVCHACGLDLAVTCICIGKKKNNNNNNNNQQRAGPFQTSRFFLPRTFTVRRSGPSAEPSAGTGSRQAFAAKACGWQMVEKQCMDPASRSLRRGESPPTFTVPAKGKARRLAAKEHAAANDKNADHRCVYAELHNDIFWRIISHAEGYPPQSHPFMDRKWGAKKPTV